ncbi:MAG TPA: pentapeptide repeat-containing protein [Cytophagaceae bacterium]|jgi:uncharacterized protein YjbI with pentapeptide repeats
MQEIYKQDQTIERIDFTQDPLPKGEYESCIFKGCNFSNADLSDFRFIDCEFNGCNISLTKINKTAFRDIKFIDSKMLGLRFESCNQLGLAFSFEGCHLNHSSFFKAKIKKTPFKNCQLREVDFSDGDLSAVVFDNCDLIGAVFDNTILEKADFRTSCNYSFDPDKNRIKKAYFSLSGIAGLLIKYDINIEQ